MDKCMDPHEDENRARNGRYIPTNWKSYDENMTYADKIWMSRNIDIITDPNCDHIHDSVIQQEHESNIYL